MAGPVLGSAGRTRQRCSELFACCPLTPLVVVAGWGHGMAHTAHTAGTEAARNNLGKKNGGEGKQGGQPLEAEESLRYLELGAQF